MNPGHDHPWMIWMLKGRSLKSVMDGENTRKTQGGKNMVACETCAQTLASKAMEHYKNGMTIHGFIVLYAREKRMWIMTQGWMLACDIGCTTNINTL